MRIVVHTTRAPTPIHSSSTQQHVTIKYGRCSMPCLLNSAHFLTLSLSVAVVHLHTAPPESLADTARRFAAFTLAGGTTMLLPASAKTRATLTQSMCKQCNSWCRRHCWCMCRLSAVATCWLVCRHSGPKHWDCDYHIHGYRV